MGSLRQKAVINPGLCLQQLRGLARVVDQDDRVSNLRCKQSRRHSAVLSKNTMAPRLKKALPQAGSGGAEL